MKDVLGKIEHSAVALLTIALVILFALHLHDARIHAADVTRIAIDAQNRAALADSNRVLKNGFTAHLAVIAKDSAGLAALGKQYAALAAQLDGIRKEKAKPVVALKQVAAVKMPDTDLVPLTSPACAPYGVAGPPSPPGEGLQVRSADQHKEVGSAGFARNSQPATHNYLTRNYREDDTCNCSEFHFSMTMHGDSMRFEKSMRIDLSTLLIVRADGTREFRGRSPCPWVTVNGIEGAVFEEAPAVSAKRESVWTSKAAYVIYGAGLLRLVQVALPMLGVR